MTEKPLATVRRTARDCADNTTPVHSINVPSKLSDEFQRVGWSALQSDELAEEWGPAFLHHLEAELRSWWIEGVEPPLELSSGNPDFIRGASHPYYAGTFDVEAFNIYRVLLDADDRSLNVLSACALYCLGADRVFIVDGSGDAGVDVLGSWLRSARQGLCISVQSKAWAGGLTGQSVEDAVHKYRAGLEKPIWQRYRALVNADMLAGLGQMFVVVSRDGFGQSALAAGRRLGALCCGPKRLALLLRSCFTQQQLMAALEAFGQLPRDPSRNVVSWLNQATS